MSRAIIATLVGLVLAFVGIQRSDAGIIDTATDWSGGGITPFGEGYNATMGQTFTVLDPDTQLDSFSFWMVHNWPNPTNLDPLTWPSFGNNQYKFKAYVMEWDAANLHPTGAQLYSSPLQSLTIDYAWPVEKSDFQQFTFNTGGIGLETGHQYVAFLSASGFFDGLINEATFGACGLGNDPYPGGALYWLSNENDFSKVTTQSWTNGNWVLDAAFQANFSSVPEPSTFVIFGGFLGMGLIGDWWRRRRRPSSSSIP